MATLEFLIDERIFYTGSVTVDLDDLKAWLDEVHGTSNLDCLTPDILQEYCSDRNIEHEERHGDVQGQEWRMFPGESWEGTIE